METKILRPAFLPHRYILHLAICEMKRQILEEERAHYVGKSKEEERVAIAEKTAPLYQKLETLRDMYLIDTGEEYQG